MWQIRFLEYNSYIKLFCNISLPKELKIKYNFIATQVA